MSALGFKNKIVFAIFIISYLIASLFDNLDLVTVVDAYFVKEVRISTIFLFVFIIKAIIPMLFAILIGIRLKDIRMIVALYSFLAVISRVFCITYSMIDRIEPYLVFNLVLLAIFIVPIRRSMNLAIQTSNKDNRVTRVDGYNVD